MYVDIGSNNGDTTMLSFAFTGTNANRVWDIKVTQLECSNRNRYKPMFSYGNNFFKLPHKTGIRLFVDFWLLTYTIIAFFHELNSMDVLYGIAFQTVRPLLSSILDRDPRSH